VACHAHNVSTLQRAELFVGGLPDHIRVDVEMRYPQDLQTAMYYARAFERRAAASQPAPAPRPARPTPRPPLPPLARAQGGGQAPAAGNAPPAAHTFRRLTPAEMQERRRQGLCYNCDEPYVPGHVCERLFYLECGDYIIEELRPRKSQTLRQRSCPNRSMVRLTLLSCRSTLLQGSARR